MWQGVWSHWIPVAVEVSSNVARCHISLDSGSIEVSNNVAGCLISVDSGSSRGV